MKKLEEWSKKDVMQWICEECRRENRDIETIPLYKLANITIKELQNMTMEDFLNTFLYEDSATFLYTCKERLFRLREAKGKSH